MGKRSYLIWGIALIFILFPSLFLSSQKVKAAEPAYQDVVINEVMWMGSSSHTADEWIELRNMTSHDIDFSQTPYALYSNDVLKVVINVGKIRTGFRMGST